MPQTPQVVGHLRELPHGAHQAHMRAIGHCVVKCGMVLQEEVKKRFVVEVVREAPLRVVPPVLDGGLQMLDLTAREEERDVLLIGLIVLEE